MLNIIAGTAHQGKTLKLINDLFNIEPNYNVTNGIPGVVIFITPHIPEIINWLLLRAFPMVGEFKSTNAGFFGKYDAVVSYFLEHKKYELVFFDSMSDFLNYIETSSPEMVINSIWIDCPINTLNHVDHVQKIIQMVGETPINMTHGLNRTAVDLMYNTENISDLVTIKSLNVTHFSVSNKLYYLADNVDFVRVIRKSPTEDRLMIYTDKIRHRARGEVHEYTILPQGVLVPME